MHPDFELPPLVELVRDLRRLGTVRERTRALQVLIGSPAKSPAELQRRALLVTALREARLWPSTA